MLVTFKYTKRLTRKGINLKERQVNTRSELELRKLKGARSGGINLLSISCYAGITSHVIQVSHTVERLQRGMTYKK